MVEELKPLDQLTDPDERQKYRNLKLEDLHEIAASIELGSAVPEVVRNQFEIARNAFVYSWFWYPFQPVASMYSILTIELALRHKLKEFRPSMFQRKNPPALFELLSVAIRNRLLVDTGFDVQYGEDHVVSIDPRNPASPLAPQDQRYCYEMLYALPRLRNELAHGEYALVPGVSHELACSAKLINQLFPG